MKQKFQIQSSLTWLNKFSLKPLNEVDTGIIKYEVCVLKQVSSILAYNTHDGTAYDEMIIKMGLKPAGVALRGFFNYLTPIYKSGNAYYGEIFNDCNILMSKNIDKFNRSVVIQNAYDEYSSASDNDLIITLNSLLF